MRLDHTTNDEYLAFRILGETDWEALRTATVTVVSAAEDLDAKLTSAYETIDELESKVSELTDENNALSARIAELEAEVDGQADREKEYEAKLNS